MRRSHSPLPRISGAEAVLILGGESRRMGQDKATRPLAGVPLYQYGYRLTCALFDRVRLVGHPRGASTAPIPLEIEPDRHPGLGPLTGVETALSGARESWVFILACDHPFVTPQFVRALAALRAEDVDVVCPHDGTRALPTLGFYRASVLVEVRSRLDGQDRSLRGALESLRPRWLTASDLEAVDPQGVCRWNLNAPHDWERAESALRDGSIDRWIDG